QDVLQQQAQELGAVLAEKSLQGHESSACDSSSGSSSGRKRGYVVRASSRGGAIWAMTPASRTPTRDASANASAMSCVTIITVLRISDWMRRNSRCSSARV